MMTDKQNEREVPLKGPGGKVIGTARISWQDDGWIVADAQVEDEAMAARLLGPSAYSIGEFGTEE